MIADGSWRTKDFKGFNLNADGSLLPRGTLHPLLKVALAGRWAWPVCPYFTCVFFLSRCERSTARFSWRWALRRCRRTALWRGEALGLSFPVVPSGCWRLKMRMVLQLVLEFRRAFPAAAAPGPRCPRHLFYERRGSALFFCLSPPFCLLIFWRSNLLPSPQSPQPRVCSHRITRPGCGRHTCRAATAPSGTAPLCRRLGPPLTPSPHSWYSPIRYQYDWQRNEAEKNLLRTHTTAVSARMLYKLAQQVRSAHPPPPAPTSRNLGSRSSLTAGAGWLSLHRSRSSRSSTFPSTVCFETRHWTQHTSPSFTRLKA